MALFYFLIPSPVPVGWDIFNLSRHRFGVIFLPHLLVGAAAFYPTGAGRGWGRHLKEFLITVLLVRSSGEQYPDNATNELRDIFHFDETKEEYFGTNIQYSFSPIPTSLVLWWMHSSQCFGPIFCKSKNIFYFSHDVFLMVIELPAPLLHVYDSISEHEKLIEANELV